MEDESVTAINKTNGSLYTPQTFQSRTHGSFQVRLAQIDDAKGIAKVGSSVFAASFGYSMAVEDMQKYLETEYSVNAIEKSLLDPKMVFLVALQNEEVVGFVQLTFGAMEPSVADQPDPVELQRLYLRADQQGSGLAKFLVDEIADLARSLGFRTMFLGVWEENYKAQRFYQKMDFHRYGEHDFVTGTCVQTDWILRKVL